VETDVEVCQVNLAKFQIAEVTPSLKGSNCQNMSQD
jgi:hypothetical protein